MAIVKAPIHAYYRFYATCTKYGYESAKAEKAASLIISRGNPDDYDRIDKARCAGLSALFQLLEDYKQELVDIRDKILHSSALASYDLLKRKQEIFEAIQGVKDFMERV